MEKVESELSNPAKTDEGLNERLWVFLLIQVFIIPIAAFLGFSAAKLVSLEPSLAPYAPGAIVITLLSIQLLMPVVVYFDKRYVKRVSDWNPSPLYYFVFLGPIGSLISVAYIWQRYRLVGQPSLSIGISIFKQ
jgi:H+/Cl- antiporter ClcA